MNRAFKQDEANKVWLTDVTEIKLKNGQKVYLSAIYDLGSKKIVSYQVSKRNDNQLVFNTFDKALKVIIPKVLFSIATEVFNIPAKISKEKSLKQK